MSSPLIGVPSSQTAACLILYVTENGLLSFLPVPLPSSVGVPSSTGDGMKLPFSSNVMSLGSTWMSTPQCIQDEFEHCVIGLRHSGHCSAPRMSVPPFFCVAELEPEPVPVALFLSLLHAAVISTKLNKRQRRALPRRCRLTYSDLLVGSQGDAVVTALPGVGVAPWRASPWVLYTTRTRSGRPLLVRVATSDPNPARRGRRGSSRRPEGP